MKKNFLRHFCSSHNSKIHPNKTFQNLLQVQNPNPCKCSNSNSGSSKNRLPKTSPADLEKKEKQV